MKNALLPDDLQHRAYRIKAFAVQPEVTLLTNDGKEETRFPSVKLAILEADFDKTLPEFLEKFGLKMEQDHVQLPGIADEPDPKAVSKSGPTAPGDGDPNAVASG